ncbi:kinetochore-associated protein 1-like [Colossoma macropomum]|uniref:kinetochore-associated protein 1-like n=1 Tax=Colossoma macropomum TaxID=42526 RepID=UPI00186420F0|nr:kinetochore-associated protein 1-like [Colossoma macropomum]
MLEIMHKVVAPCNDTIEKPVQQHLEKEHPNELYQHHPNSSTGRVLFSTAQRLCQMLEDNVPMVLPERVNLPALIHKLACQAITICHTDLLLDCVELCKSTRGAADVYRQCQTDDYGFVSKISDETAERGRRRAMLQRQGTV